MVPAYLERIKVKQDKKKDELKVSAPVTERDCIKCHRVPRKK